MSDASRTRHLLSILAVGLLLFLTNLGATRLWDVDEAIFSQAAVEMQQRGDWVTPYFNGEMFGHKPPVMYWFQIAAFQLFGKTEFAARFFSAIFGIGTMLLTYELGRTLLNPRTGLWSAIALGSCINFAVIARAATPDAYLTFFCTLALLILVKATVRAETSPWNPVLPPGWKGYALGYATMGAAVMVKGPLGVVIPMAVWGMFLLIEQRRQEVPENPSLGWRRAVSWFAPLYFLQTVWRMRPITAVLMVLAVAAPWYVWVGVRTNGEFLQEFFFKHNFGRATTAMDSHSGPFYYYLIAIAIGTFPWCVLLGPAIANLVRSIRNAEPTRAAHTLLACWTCVWVGCFSLVSTKLPSYIIPAYPALAVSFAALVDRWLEAGQLAECRRWLRAAWGTTAVAGIGICMAVPIVTHIYLDGEWTPALVGLVPLVGAAIGFYFVQREEFRRSLLVLPVVGVLFCIGLFGFAAIPIDAHQNSQMFTDFVREHSVGEPALVSHNYQPPSLVYYGARPIQTLSNTDEIIAYFEKHPTDAFLITTDRHYQRMVNDLPEEIAVLKKDRRFLRSGEVLLLGRKESLTVAHGSNSPQLR